jgi:hypothetical protein
MKTLMSETRRDWLPAVNPPEIVTALAWDQGGRLWAGGAGGVASYNGSGWTWRSSGLPLTAITALLCLDQGILAGGLEGIALYDERTSAWQRAAIAGDARTITAFAASPTFDQDRTLLAASLTAGILKSTDCGISWAESGFGLQTAEILALLWVQDTVIAASDHGLYRSPNQGRAWKQVYDGEAVIALTRLDDGTLMGALESGGVILSSDQGVNWRVEAPLLTGAQTILSLSGSLIGTDDGLFERDGATGTWTRAADGAFFSLAAENGRAKRVAAAVGSHIQIRWTVPGEPAPIWTLPPGTPIHDLRRVILIGEDVLAAGRHSGLLRFHDREWHPVEGTPLPLTLITRQADRLYASGVNGLFRSHDQGVSWQPVWEGSEGHLSHLAFLTEKLAFGSRADGSHLTRTSDGGKTWQITPSPFGVLPVIALEVTPQLILIAVFDPRRNVIVLWRSADGGVRWFPGAEVPSEWGIAASFSSPLMIALPDVLLVSPPHPADVWLKAEFDVPGVRVRKIVGSEQIQYALTLAHGIFQSRDGGRHWLHLPLGLGDDEREISDLDYHAGKLAILLTGGRVLVVH